MAKKNKKLIDWVFLIFWLALIFYLSSIPSLSSSFQPLYDLVLRKIAHFAEYAVLTLLIFRVLSDYSNNKTRNIIFALILAIVYATSDEWHQSFVPGRQMALTDIIIDASGSLIMTLYLWKK